MSEHKNNDWSVAKAVEYYNIDGWGAGYFGINDKGHLCIFPYGQPGPTSINQSAKADGEGEAPVALPLEGATRAPTIDILDVLDEIKDKKLSLPCVVRFQDILRSRVQTLTSTFSKHIAETGYSGKYFGVYPIKVNQMREVVEEILDAGAESHFGLEAGSKGELLPVLAYNDDPEALTICNGYKDEDFMRLAMLGRKLGRKIIVVIEKLSELPLLLRVAEEMQVEPIIGIRAKLSTPGAGKWVSSSGDFAKFGLTAPEIIQAVKILKGRGKEETLKLFHFHAGSQLTDIRSIKEAVKEGARFYAKLRKMGLDIDYFDVGGGLGVDYEGSNTTSDSSVNYTLDEYAADVVDNVRQICADEKVPEPHLVSESGRAVTAHHSCIIMSVFGSIQLGEEENHLNGTDSDVVLKMREIVAGLTPKNLQAVFHDATALKEEALSMFKLGILDLEERAKIESLYWRLCRQIVQINSRRKRVPKDTAHLEKLMADQCLANFSLFQSAPDHWAFDQLFPIVPLERLNEPPLRESTIVDITCDSDGKIDQFIDQVTPRPTLALHELKPGESYHVGMFLLGAYQDIMGDMHNLFGRVNEVHVFCDDEDPEDFYLEEVIPGENIADVLCHLQYFPAELAKTVKKAVDEKIKGGTIKPKEGMNLVEFYERVMKSYTYLETTQYQLSTVEAEGKETQSQDPPTAEEATGPVINGSSLAEPSHGR
ncbi:MAG: biosynthetic arginine decarboxylase [Deltaproteobacteria bacterium]|nr:biosynthetic arginine decarboxylase [Deltaproteobacteria bacterium]